MGKWFLFIGMVCFAANGLSQNNAGTRQPPPGTISSGSTNATISTAGTNYSSNNSLTLTNSAGGSFSVEQLGSQIQALRTTVEQTLPMLSAFNERYSAAQPGSRLGQAIQNIFSGNKNQAQGSSSTAGQEITNVLAALGSLVSTNGQGQNVSPNTLRDLVTLQKDLQPVQQTLQSLSFTSSSTNQTSIPTGGVPSPTGR